MEVFRSINADKIHNIITHPKVLYWLTDDNSTNYEVILHPQIIYIMNKAETGMIRVDPFNSICCSVHIATLPELWGQGQDFAESAIRWGFKNTMFQKIIGMIPAYNDRVISLVNESGFGKREY